MLSYNNVKTTEELEAIHDANVEEIGFDNYIRYGEPLFVLYTEAFTRIKHRSEALRVLESLKDNADLEYTHSVADKVLCNVLCSLGFEDIVKSYSELDKWYA